MRDSMPAMSRLTVELEAEIHYSGGDYRVVKKQPAAFNNAAALSWKTHRDELLTPPYKASMLGLLSMAHE